MVNYISRVVLFVSFVFAASFLCLTPARLHAQTVSGTILGTVQDQQGAVIGKANVSAKSLDTGAVRTATSEDNGSYRIASVPAGSYEVSATAPGFKTDVRTGIVITVGAEQAANFSMTVGAVSEKIEVTADAAQVDTSSSTLAGFVNATTIRELPLNGRDWLQLALLQPGAVLNTGQNQLDARHGQRGNGTAMSISGGRVTENAFRIDGILVNDYANAGPGSTLRVNLGVDAIREFSVLTTNYSSEYGMSSAGVVNAITKSGTNEYHGGGYFFHRNTALDARNFFDKEIPAFRRHQFGGFLGGAVKKDKTFFFGNYESLREIKSLTVSLDTLSPNARQGILTSGTVAIDPRIKPYLPVYPLPNAAINGDTGKYTYGAPRAGIEHYYVGKVDHYFSAATTLNGTYMYDKTDVSVPDDYNIKDSIAPSRRHNLALNLQHIFGPTLINSTRLGFSRTLSTSSLDGNGRLPELRDLSLGFMPGKTMGSFACSCMPALFSGIGAGLGDSGPNTAGYTTPQFYNDLSWNRGKHNLRMGFGFERIQHNLYNGATPNGTWTFTSIRALLTAQPTQFSSDLPGADPTTGMRMSIFQGYFQDDYRVLPNLTINLGLRYETGSSVTDVNGRVSNLRSLTDATPTLGDPYYNNPSRKNFAPRIGFSWDPFKDGKTAIRGGVGIFDMLILPYNFQGRLTRALPYFVGGRYNDPVGLAAAFPNKILPLLGPASLGVAHVEPNPGRGYKAQWNFNIQRQLNRTMALTVGYVGSSGVRLVRPIEDIDQVPGHLARFDTASNSYRFPVPALNSAGVPNRALVQRINPRYGSIRSSEWNGHSIYHSLQVNLVQRPIKGLAYQIAYTWSKTIDAGSSVFSEGGESANSSGGGWAFDDKIQRGVSDFNIPHNFVFNYQYDIPMPAAVRSHAFTNTVLGGWAIGGIYTRQSGGPYSLKIGVDRAYNGNSNANGGISSSQRPMFVQSAACSSPRAAITGNVDRYLNLSCFAFPEAGQLGNLGRNNLTRGTFRNLDFSIFKNQNLIGERLKAQFRVEMFNVMNNTNIQPQLQTVFDGNGNLTTQAGTPTGYFGTFTTNTSRQIQVGLRLFF